MEDEQIKARIGANIAYYRKQAGLTQVGLASESTYHLRDCHFPASALPDLYHPVKPFFPAKRQPLIYQTTLCVTVPSSVSFQKPVRKLDFY